MTIYKRLALTLVAVFAVFGAMSASAFASSAPTVTTMGAITEGTGGEGVFGGTVNANGLTTKYHFEYGPTSAYGSTTETGSAGSGTKSQEVYAFFDWAGYPLYHYRLVATNVDGTSYSEDRTTSPNFTELERFSGKSSGRVSIETGSGDKFSCSGATLSGEVVSETEVNGTMKFNGCEGGGGTVCSNAGAAEIETVALTGKLGWITTTEAGLRLSQKGGGSEFATYKCATGGLDTTVKVKGSVIAPIRNANRESLSYSFEYLNAKPLVKNFEWDPERALEAEATGYLSFSGAYAFATELTLSSTETGKVLQVQ